MILASPYVWCCNLLLPSPLSLPHLLYFFDSLLKDYQYIVHWQGRALETYQTYISLSSKIPPLHQLKNRFTASSTFFLEALAFLSFSSVLGLIS